MIRLIGACSGLALTAFLIFVAIWWAKDLASAMLVAGTALDLVKDLVAWCADRLTELAREHQ